MRLQQELDHLHALGFGTDDYRWLDRDEMQSTLGIDRAMAAIHMKHCAAIHPSRLARGLAETVESLGVRIYENSAVTAIRAGQVRTANGTIKAETVLVATEAERLLAGNAA
jgi:glycine/D-amino acid oxidase-like deaminating enzyme